MLRRDSDGNLEFTGRMVAGSSPAVAPSYFRLAHNGPLHRQPCPFWKPSVFPAAARPVHHEATSGAPSGHAGGHDHAGLMPVSRGSGVHRVRVSLDQPHSTAARAGSRSKGSSRVEVVSEHESTAKRGGPNILVDNPDWTAAFPVHHRLFDLGSKAAVLPFRTAQATHDKVIELLGN